jgi:putative transposase
MECLRVQQNRQLTETIQCLFAASRQTYGSPRIHADLKALGVPCGVHRVARLMRKAAIRPVPVRRFVATTDSDHALPVAQNCLNREFSAEKADVRWASDITYLWTSEGWLYLAVVLDLFSRRIVGWSLASTLHKEIVLDALAMALKRRQTETGLLLHSDRGSQYASLAYQERLLEAGVVCSMSRKGNCWDNAPAESFFATLKRELVRCTRFETREAARGAVFEWIEVWYNRKRRHSALGYLSPVQFEEQKTNLA